MPVDGYAGEVWLNHMESFEMSSVKKSIVIAGERLRALAEAFQLSRASYRLTATNVGLALIWNGLGMLAALSGRVDPVWAMLAMAISVSAVLFRSISSRLLEPTS